MGTNFTLLLYAQDEKQATEASARAFARLDHLNAVLTDYDSTSELNQLSYTAGQGKSVGLSRDLWNVLHPALELASQTDGAFDPTIGPVVTLWRMARETGTLPDPEAIVSARKAVGFDKVVLNENHRSARLTAPNMKLDLGGIAKGYAGDEILKTLAGLGIESALVNAGGDITVGAAPPGREGWRIGIGALEAAASPPNYYIVIDNASIATSGDAWQYVEIEGKRFSHLVDPRTGIGLTDHSSVTVIVWDHPGRNGLLADALASALSVMGPEKGLGFVDQRENTAALIVRKPGDHVETYRSSSFSRLNPLTREEVEAMRNRP
jgi:thiamine biosynthesis lipoprotein